MALGRPGLAFEVLGRLSFLLVPVRGRAKVYWAVSSAKPKDMADTHLEMARFSLSGPIDHKNKKSKQMEYERRTGMVTLPKSVYNLLVP